MTQILPEFFEKKIDQSELNRVERKYYKLLKRMFLDVYVIITGVQLESSSNWLWSLSLSLSNQCNTCHGDTILKFCVMVIS
jgi:hypothetical protein